jgi:hypothetical protein
MSSRWLARRSDQMPAPSGVRPVVIEHGEWRKRRGLHLERPAGSRLRHPERSATVER